MSSRTPGDALKKFLSEIKETGLLSKYDKILELISGSIKIAKDKIKVIDSVCDVTDFLPGIPVEYKSDLREVILEGYEEEVERAELLLKEIETTIGSLQTISETFNQRTFEGIRSQNPQILDNQEVYTCHENCRQVLMFLKLKANILKHYLIIPFDSQPDTVPLADLDEYEADILCQIRRLEFVDLPVSKIN